VLGNTFPRVTYCTFSHDHFFRKKMMHDWYIFRLINCHKLFLAKILEHQVYNARISVYQMREFLAVILQPLFFLKNHFNLHEKKPFSKFIIRNLTFCQKRKLKAKWPTYCWNWFPFPLYCTYVFDEVLLQSPGCLIVKMFPASIFLLILIDRVCNSRHQI
jgi:hypothetical protein